METSPSLLDTPKGAVKNYGFFPFVQKGESCLPPLQKRKHHALLKNGRDPGFPLQPNILECEPGFPRTS